MESKKNVFFLLFLLALGLLSTRDSALAEATDRCANIRKQLIVLEQQIQSSKLSPCEGETCSSFLELQTKHNALMGKLVVYEGLVSIGQAIEGDHLIIKNLGQRQLGEASKNVDSFLTNFRKAALIDKSLDTNFWVDEQNNEYQGETISELLGFVETQCAKDNEDIQSFCSNLRGAANEPGVDYTELLLSLSNFAMADRRTRLSPADRQADYDNYKKTLQLVINNKLVGYDSEEVREEIGDIKRLKRKLTEFQENRSHENASEVLALAKDLETVEMNFGELVNAREEFQDFFNNDLKKGIASFNHASRSLFQKDKITNNLENLDLLFDRANKSASLSIIENIKEATDCSGSDSAIISCFEAKCDRGASSGECQQNSNNQNIIHQLHPLNNQLRARSELNQVKDKIEEAKQCVDKPLSSEQARQCITKLKADLGLASQDKVEELRRDLHRLEAAMEEMNDKEPFYSLKLSKAMGLMAYRNSGCLGREDELKSDRFHSTCRPSQIGDFAQEALRLSEDTGQILDFTQNPFINSQLKMPAGDFSFYKEKFLEHCSSSENANIGLCEMYQNDDVASGRMRENFQRAGRSLTASKTENRRLPSKVSFDEVERASPGKSFFSGLATAGLTQGLPFFMHLDSSKRNHRQMMNYHQNRLSYMQSRRDYLSQNPQIPIYHYPNTNYGYSLYDYGQSSQFGGDSAQAIFHDPYDFTQFSFPPSSIVDASGNQSFGLDNSSSEGFNFGP
ncbi:MAG: hypothetical protein WD025_00075 [Bacteriovoracaceae bacterium]